MSLRLSDEVMIARYPLFLDGVNSLHRSDGMFWLLGETNFFLLTSYNPTLKYILDFKWFSLMSIAKHKIFTKILAVVNTMVVQSGLPTVGV